jgi:coenzyme F420-reducing hydrogenase delta subunit
MVAIPCVGKIQTLHLLKAFEFGADGVLVAGCTEEDCPDQEGIFWARRRLETARKMLQEIGLKEKLLEMYNLSTAEFQEFDRIITEFAQRLKSRGEAG